MEIFHNDWAEFLNPELKKPYYLELRKFLVDEYKTRQIFPDMYDIFNALHYTSEGGAFTPGFTEKLSPCA